MKSLKPPLYNADQEEIFERIMVNLQKRNASMANVVRQVAILPQWKKCGYVHGIAQLRAIMESAEWHDWLKDWEVVQTAAQVAAAFDRVPGAMAMLIAKEKRDSILVQRARSARERDLQNRAEIRLEEEGEAAGPLLGDDEPLTTVATTVKVAHPAIGEPPDDD